MFTYCRNTLRGSTFTTSWCSFRKVSWRQPSFLELPFNEHQKANSSDSRPKWRHVDDTFQIPPSSAACLGRYLGIHRHSCSPIRTSIGSCPLQHLQMSPPRVACSHVKSFLYGHPSALAHCNRNSVIPLHLSTTKLLSSNPLSSSLLCCWGCYYFWSNVAIFCA